jgi:oligopeptide/dipeptide ABC transporter ATP-binding protein
MVFQDTFGSLDPRMTITDVLTEPFTIHREVLSKDLWPDKVRELLALAGLDPHHANRYPHQFSGGQRQRIGIARALALDPKVLVCDEPVSALDVSVQAQIINLLKDLQDRLGLSYVFVAHDLSIVRQIADRVAVMYAGKLMELGPAKEVYANPKNPYTAGLLRAIPDIDVREERLPAIKGSPPNLLHPPTGCPFHPRCPYATDICVEQMPPLEPVAPEHTSACWHADKVER